jgi:hypothetical protein
MSDTAQALARLDTEAGELLAKMEQCHTGGPDAQWKPGGKKRFAELQRKLAAVRQSQDAYLFKPES